MQYFYNQNISVNSVYWFFDVYKINSNQVYRHHTDTVVLSGLDVINDDLGQQLNARFNFKGNIFSCSTFSPFIYYFDFDNGNGKVTNGYYKKLDSTIVSNSICFSPNDSILYLTSQIDRSKCNSLNYASNVLQLNLGISLLNPPIYAISGSNTWIEPRQFRRCIDSAFNYRFVQTSDVIQLAPNGKIYITRPTVDSLDAINNPNVFGVGCNFQRGAIKLADSSYNLYGLPTYVVGA